MQQPGRIRHLFGVSRAITNCCAMRQVNDPTSLVSKKMYVWRMDYAFTSWFTSTV